ncbi:MAG: hypothetical protein R6X25_00620, partial [Candidatus Krumholzibacteriia bacterium]
MRKLATIGELEEFRDRILREVEIQSAQPTLLLGAGTCGQASGANDVIRIVKRQILDRGLQGQLRLRITGCQGFCALEPYLIVEPGQHLYPKVKMADVPRIVDAALAGTPVEELLYRDPRDGRACATQQDIPFFGKQKRTLLGSNQKLDPIRIFDYIEQGGYAALEQVLSRRDPDWVIAEVQAAGIRGRGGAGFPTGRKWALARASQGGGGRKYVVCNADEGDPGAYMDRSLLEGNPHSIIEGMLIAGFAIGADRGILYVRGEYPLAIKHTLIALRQARELGLLGRNILDTGFDFDLEIVKGAGAFVCGEETALIRSIESHAGEPRQRPPYPIEKGIDGCPPCINNVETLDNIPVIINGGGGASASVGQLEHRLATLATTARAIGA